MKTKIFIPMVLFAALCSFDAYSQNKMKILSYNTHKTFQGDSTIQEQYINWVREIDPDIIAYQEMNNFTQGQLEVFAARYGHPYAVLSKAKDHRNPVALSSKYPIVNVRKVVDNMWHTFLYAEINGIHIFVVHFSSSYYTKRAEELRLVLAHAATLPQDDRILIMGDFNAFERKDADSYGEELWNTMKNRDEKYTQRNLNNGALDYSVMDLMTLAGFKDTYWLTNDHFKHSLPTKKYLTRAIRRIDYIWANPVMAKDITASDIIHDKATDEMSDHYPMYIEFNSN